MDKKILISGLLMAAVTVFAVAEPKYISPNNDGIQDELAIPMKISDKRYVQGWSLVIMDSNHNVVRTIENKIARPTKMTFKAFFKQLFTPKQGVKSCLKKALKVIFEGRAILFSIVRTTLCCESIITRLHACT